MQLKQCLQGNLQAPIRMLERKKRCKNSDLNFYLTKLEKKVQMKTKASRGKETINIRAEINKTENKKQRKLTKSKDGCLKN